MNNRKRKAIKLAAIREINVRCREAAYLAKYGRWAVRFETNKLIRLNSPVSQDAFTRAQSWSVNADSFRLFQDAMPDKRRSSKVRLSLSFSQLEAYANYQTNGTFRNQ